MHDVGQIRVDANRRHALHNEALGTTLVLRARQLRFVDDKGAIVFVIHLS